MRLTEILKNLRHLLQTFRAQLPQVLKLSRIKFPLKPSLITSPKIPLHMTYLTLNTNLRVFTSPSTISPNFATVPQQSPLLRAQTRNLSHALPLPRFLPRVNLLMLSSLYPSLLFNSSYLQSDNWFLMVMNPTLIYWQRLFHHLAKTNESPMLELSGAWKSANNSKV